jgi:hypothetical protein
MLPPGPLPKSRSAKRRRRLTIRPTRALSSDPMERRNGLRFLMFLLLFSAPSFHPPAAVEADGPLVVAETAAAEPTVLAPPLPTRLPLDRPPKVQSRRLESEDVTSLALDVLPLFPPRRAVLRAPTPVLQLMHARFLRPPSALVELAMETKPLPASR